MQRLNRVVWFVLRKAASVYRHDYSGCTTRQLQVFAALCMREFCMAKAIKHEAIDELFLHLVSVATAADVPAWEQRGAVLALNGRGDPTSEGLLPALPPDILDSFHVLVESCVEVGLADMYGRSTDLPSRFVADCVKLLKENGVEPPSIDPILSLCGGEDGWGMVSTKQELSDVLARYGVDVRHST